MSLVYLVVLVPAQDFASGNFRAHLAAAGVHLWNNMWFGGHPLPSYGLVSAQLSGWLGARVVGAIAVMVATWGFTRLVSRTGVNFAGSAAWSSVLFAVCCGINLWAGRLTFAPSVAFAVLSLVAIQSDHVVAGAVASCACALSSPVGALFLLLILLALWLGNWERRRLYVPATTCAVPLAIVLALFPEGGWFPFRWQSLFMVVVNMAVLTYAARSHRVVRTAMLLYAALVVAAFIVRSPLGGNVVRLGWLTTGALSLLFVPMNRRLLTVGIVVLTIAWNGVYLPFDRSLTVASAHASFYEPVERFLASVPGVHRVEVVSTDTRREADVLAQHFPLARGWQTQVDRARNPIFYSDALTTTTYGQWLQENAVSYIAVPKRLLHHDARVEASIVKAMTSELRVVENVADWTIYEVRSPQALATNGAEVVKVTPESLQIRADRPGWSVVRFRYTHLYVVASGDACIEPTSDGWIHLLVRSPGEITLNVRLNLDDIGRSSDQCS